jgi:hypothetical protein
MDALLTIWPVRFGAPASDEARSLFENADLPTLTRWLVRAQSAQTPADVFTEP